VAARTDAHQTDETYHSHDPHDPRAEYQRRLSACRADEARLLRIDERVSYARLATLAVAVVIGWMVLRRSSLLSWWWLALPAIGFIALVLWHDRVIRARQRLARIVAWYERGLARIDDRWMGTGERGDRFRNEAHLFAIDLDLFGDGSLFQLLNTAQTRAGEETLAAWLATPAPASDASPASAPATGSATRDAILERQAAVRDLMTRTGLREDLATAGVDVRAEVNPDVLVQWATKAPVLRGRWGRVAAAILGGIAAIAAAGAISDATDLSLLLVSLFVNALFGGSYRWRVDSVVHAAADPARELKVLAEVLARLQHESFSAERLKALRGALEDSSSGTADGSRSGGGAAGHAEAVRAVRRLRWIVEMHDWEHNIFFAPIAAGLLWGTQCAFAIEAWRERHGPAVAAWLQIVGEFEALASLAAYTYEHPADPFPEIVEMEHRSERSVPVYEAEQLAHPLIPRARAVPNDVRLGASPQALIVSGSNMSGKSTLLRSVGINAVLALAGAPVRARRLRLSPVAIGATLRIQDSLQAGRSRFYAEITRIRQLVDVARGRHALLFLLDELFHGTNSHDRVAGAHGVLQSLLDLDAIGLVTTHDLALAAIADTLAPRVANVHFDDSLVDGEIHFDYRLKPGPVTRSNALALMRAVGLDVEAEEPEPAGREDVRR
jgi:hypothetical protein